MALFLLLTIDRILRFDCLCSCDPTRAYASLNAMYSPPRNSRIPPNPKPEPVLQTSPSHTAVDLVLLWVLMSLQFVIGYGIVKANPYQ